MNRRANEEKNCRVVRVVGAVAVAVLFILLLLLLVVAVVLDLVAVAVAVVEVDLVVATNDNDGDDDMIIFDLLSAPNSTISVSSFFSIVLPSPCCSSMTFLTEGFLISSSMVVVFSLASLMILLSQR